MNTFFNVFSRLHVAGFLLCALLFSSGVASAQIATETFWRETSEAAIVPVSQPYEFPANRRTYTLDFTMMRTLLQSAPLERTPRAKSSPLLLSIPTPEGRFATFAIVESPVMEEGLAAQFPDMRTYAGQGIDDRTATIRLDVTPAGFHAMVYSHKGDYLIDPYSRFDVQHYVLYSKLGVDLASSRMRREGPCLLPPEPEIVAQIQRIIASGIATPVGSQLRTYRLACAATGEYTTFHGGTVPLGLAAIVTTTNRVDGVYEREVAVRLVLVANNNLLVYTNPATDPYSNGNPSALLTENQTNLDAVINTANYDIGHVFSTGGGGLAGLGVVCRAGLKARGETGSPAPIGDPFDIDYVAHEIGHQFGGNHTFNGSTGSCSGGNRNASTAYEPGSGSTIMAYAGICSPQDLQPNSDAYFHSISYSEIVAYTTVGLGNGCPAITNTGNGAPVVNAGTGGFAIPAQTPFSLTGSATDPNGDAMTYNWEEFDLGTAGAPGNPANPPFFRSWSSDTSPTRVFPRLSNLLNNTLPVGEVLPNATRALNFRLTARDNRVGGSGVDFSTISFNVTAAAGPFTVTSPNTAVTWAGGSTQTITWNVANTDLPPISTANVKISLSTNGGVTFPTVISASTPNDGTEAVTIPSIGTTTARIKVEAVNNIYFDVSNTNFTIQSSLAVTTTVPPANGFFTLPSPFTLDVNFNSPVDPASVQTSDLSVSGIPGASVSGATVLPGNTTVRFTISGIAVEGSLTASISAGAITDPSGNPNLAFSATYGVRSPASIVFPYFHTFPVGTNWTVNQTTNLWQLAFVTGPRGSTDTVAKADFFNIIAGNVGYLRSPLMNLPVIPPRGTSGSLLMTFHVAYSAYIGGENDSLAVVLSTDGGLTFPNVLWVKSRNSTPSLATLPQSNLAYFPSAASDWRYETVNLSPYNGQSNVVIAFRANSQFGNNCFIDNVRINLAQNLTAHTVNGAGYYAGDGGIYVFFSSFGLTQPPPVQGSGQHVSMNLDGSSIGVSIPGEKVPRLNVPNAVSTSVPTSLNIPGGTLYIASYTGRAPTTSPVEFAQNTTAPTTDFSIFTPNNVSDNRWWTITYSGDDSIRAFWQVEIDHTQLPGVSQAQKLYIMERTERDTSWIARATTITGGTRLTRGSLRRGFVDVAVGSRTEYNPNIWNQLKGNVRVMLQGPYNTGTGQMNTALKSSGILATRFGLNVPANAVDSVAVEIRNAPTAAASTIRQFQPAWLLRDGTIVNFADTTKNYIEFGGAPNGSYYLAVWHRNHLAVMSAAAQPLNNVVPAAYNFTTSQGQAYGTNPMILVNPGVYAAYAGDANGSAIITASDANGVFGVLSLTGYDPNDINLSGIVTAADANIVFGNLNVSSQVSRPTVEEIIVSPLVGRKAGQERHDQNTSR